jgi:hypothetical protein
MRCSTMCRDTIALRRLRRLWSYGNGSTAPSVFLARPSEAMGAEGALLALAGLRQSTFPKAPAYAPDLPSTEALPEAA